MPANDFNAVHALSSNSMSNNARQIVGNEIDARNKFFTFFSFCNGEDATDQNTYFGIMVNKTKRKKRKCTRRK